MTHIVAVVFLNSYHGKRHKRTVPMTLHIMEKRHKRTVPMTHPRDTPGKRTQKDRPHDTPVTHRVSFCEVPVSAVVYVGLQAD